MATSYEEIASSPYAEYYGPEDNNMFTITVTCKCGVTTTFKTTDNATSCDCDGCFRSFAVQVWN